MGTRAIIRKNGKFLYATHWDGDPATLGKEIYKAIQHMEDIDNNIKKIAERHTIDNNDEKSYGDFAEYEYDIRDDGAYFRKCSGAYDDDKERKCGEWVKLANDG